MLFLLGIVVDLVSSLVFLVLALALCRLLSGVNKTHASLLVAVVGASVVLSFMNVLSNIAALTLFRGAPFLSAFSKEQLDAMGLLRIGLHRQGIVVDEMLWGLWLFPFGVLVKRSGFLPRILGIWLIANCIAYVALSLTRLLLPQYEGIVSRITFPVLFGELAIMLWLVVKGIKVQPSAAAAS